MVFQVLSSGTFELIKCPVEIRRSQALTFGFNALREPCSTLGDRSSVESDDVFLPRLNEDRSDVVMPGREVRFLCR